VLVLLGEEATVKRFCRLGDAVLLQPENPTVEPIVVRDVRIVSKVVGLIRWPE
jgi:repressor LexA